MSVWQLAKERRRKKMQISINIVTVVVLRPQHVFEHLGNRCKIPYSNIVHEFGWEFTLFVNQMNRVLPSFANYTIRRVHESCSFQSLMFHLKTRITNHQYWPQI